MDDDDAGLRSIFAVVYYFQMDPPCFGLVELDHHKVYHRARFSQPEELTFVEWMFSSPTSSTEDEDLYMVPRWDLCPGYKLNFRTGKFLPISPALPTRSPEDRALANFRGHMYYISYSKYYSLPLFQCYDPVKDRWYDPKSVGDAPFYFGGPTVAIAVSDDTILFNVNSCCFWAYYVSGNKWYHVRVRNLRCYDIVGEAVVLKTTIYALANQPSYSVLALSFSIKPGIDGDLVFECDLISENLVKVPEPVLFKDDEAWKRSRDLVHLGQDNFCLVQTCTLDDLQPMQLTYIKLQSGKEEGVIVVSNCIYDLRSQHNESFHFAHCFSVCNTTVLKKHERTVFDRSVFDINPYPKEDHASSPGQEEEIATTVPEEIVTPVQEEIVTLHKDGLHATSELFLDNDSSQTNIIGEEGRSIYVRKLPSNATRRQLEKGLTEFGPIMKDGIRVGKEKGKLYAYVEFESVTSKQRAIEVSSMKIRDYQTEILEKRGVTGVTRVDCSNTTQAVGSSSFGKNKSNKHGEVSRSKTTCGGHNGGWGVYQQPRRPKGVCK